MDLQLTGKVALITGGSDGIGKATATELAREGAHVAICGRRQDAIDEAVAEIKQEAKGQVLGIQADVTSLADIERFVATAAQQLGRIDILVNNAGTSAAGSFETITDEMWAADLDLKLWGAIRASRAVIPHMRAVGGGRIINIATPGGKAPGAGSTPTSVSRAAGLALTKAMSKDLAKDNILVNAVCVGVIKSGQQRRMIGGRFPDLSLDEAYARAGENIPLGRIGEAREVAAVITLLASPMGGYVTGTSINVDGGTAATL